MTYGKHMTQLFPNYFELAEKRQSEGNTFGAIMALQECKAECDARIAKLQGVTSLFVEGKK